MIVKPTYRIHIKGIVQGVGFRPYIYQEAKKRGFNGWVVNGSNGVIIEVNTEKKIAKDWLQDITINAPRLSIIDSAELKEVEGQLYNEFEIKDSIDSGPVDIPLTPDFAICSDCKAEVENNSDPRFDYAFTTCTNCGPRYSITQKVPYDRPTTTMEIFEMCERCSSEYNDPEERRHYSQTNSCPDCGIHLEIYDTTEKIYYPLHRERDKIDFIVSAIQAGQIVAVKGIGGYLLLCDARDDSAVSLLRLRKHRPHKPLAVMYPDLESVNEQYKVSGLESNALESPEAPIVLLHNKRNLHLSEHVAPGLDSVGVMLPYAPILYLIANKTNTPLVATSGNVSGSPVLYKDEDSIKELSSIADWIVTNDREILIPQDDSVIRFGKSGQRIILRRSRGYAPNYFGNKPEMKYLDNVLAVGAEMKGSFGLVHNDKMYISQYLGAMNNLNSQESFEKVFSHLSSVLGFEPRKVISDLHPGYFGYGWCEEKSNSSSVIWNQYQHHEAHFASVLGENDLLDPKEPVLGFIWDGTGLSPDNQIWGSETFLWKDAEMSHIGNIGQTQHLSGDQMALQPRLSLLAFTQNPAMIKEKVKPFFSEEEWNSFTQVKEKARIKTSSMGRLFDAISCLLTNTHHNTYEGEAAMLLESLARKGKRSDSGWDVKADEPFYKQVLMNVYRSMEQECDHAEIAYWFHDFLAQWIQMQAEKNQVKKLAFSGGVFQNALLVDLITDKLSNEYELYFHKELSPNDENIAHGQLMLELINHSKKEVIG